MNEPISCSVCGAQVRYETTTYVQEVDERLTAVTDVPVQACPQCGEQFFSPETVDKLQQLLSDRSGAEPAPKTIVVPVYPFL